MRIRRQRDASARRNGTLHGTGTSSIARRSAALRPVTTCVIAIVTASVVSATTNANAALALVTAVEAESMTLPAGSSIVSDTQASDTKAVMFATNGTATGVVAPETSVDTITLRVRGDRCKGAPQLGLAIDGVSVATVSVSSTTWTDYTVSQVLAAGNRSVAVSYRNDFVHNRNCDRNLYLDKLSFHSTTSTTAVSPAAPSGQAMPVGDLPGWRQIFTDDFTTNVALGSFPGAVSTKWSAYPHTYKDTTGRGTYWPEKVVSIRDGLLDMWLHTETINGVPTHLVSAPIPNLPLDDSAVSSQTASSGLRYTYLTYGRYAVRFRADPVSGYKTAWLLWPWSNDNNRDGEIDFPEGNLDNRICAFMHRTNAVTNPDQYAACTQATYPTWHTAVIEWSPNLVEFFLDGTRIGSTTQRIPFNPMRYILQTETATDGVVPSSTAQGHVQVDWVTVYARA